MNFRQDGLALAAERRARFFSQTAVGADVVVAFQPANRGYLTGYFSMAQDIVPGYRAAVVATASKVVLVTGAADAGPALEWVDGPDAIFRYGTFYFEVAAGQPDLYTGRPTYPDFDAALVAAVDGVSRPGDTIGLDLASMTDPMTAPLLERLHPHQTVSSFSALAQARCIKLPGEMERIRHATKLVELGLETVRTTLRPGMTEAEIAAIITCEMAAGGARPYLVSVTSGPRSALADAYPTRREIARGELLRIDAGCVVDGFCSDMARTFVIGEPDALIARRHDAIVRGLHRELELVRAGMCADHLFRETIETVRRHGIPNYRRHHCGHGLGIGGYEMPIIAAGVETPLQEGMCLCVETPFYELGWGGMMIEDTIRVTETGYEPITKISQELFVC